MSWGVNTRPRVLSLSLAHFSPLWVSWLKGMRAVGSGAWPASPWWEEHHSHESLNTAPSAAGRG